MDVKGLRVGDVVIEEVDLRSLSEEDIVAVNTFQNIMRAESNPEDPPRPVELTRANVRNIPEIVWVREYWGRDPDGSIAAVGAGSYLRTEENRHLLQVGVIVRPDRRRRGLGRALLGLVADVAEQEGRTLLMGSTSERVPAGEAFATLLGAERAIANHINRLLLADVDRDLVARWVTEGPGRAPDYTLVAVDGGYPDDLVEDIAALYDVMNTAPRDGLDMEDMHFTAEHLRQFEKSMLAQGTQGWTLLARHDPTGELAGFTEVFWNPKRPETVGQGNTGVRPEHRGHGLGKWLKAAMLERVLAERPEAVDVRTGNADSNDAMLSINDQLGFQRFEAIAGWQVKLETVRAYLGSRS